MSHITAPLPQDDWIQKLVQETCHRFKPVSFLTVGEEMLQRFPQKLRNASRVTLRNIRFWEHEIRYPGLTLGSGRVMTSANASQMDWSRYGSFSCCMIGEDAIAGHKLAVVTTMFRHAAATAKVVTMAIANEQLISMMLPISGEGLPDVGLPESLKALRESTAQEGNILGEDLGKLLENFCMHYFPGTVFAVQTPQVTCLVGSAHPQSIEWLKEIEAPLQERIQARTSLEKAWSEWQVQLQQERFRQATSQAMSFLRQFQPQE